jgi:DNA-binding response OmpR family regulator
MSAGKRLQHDAPAVLVVDDEPRIVEILRDYLEASGFAVRFAYTGEEALDALRSAAPDCVLLDVMLPGRDGFDVCRDIRATSDVPVLFLTARDGDIDKIRGLGLAEDYIVKNASPSEIVARVRNAIRHSESAYRRQRVIDHGRVLLDLGAHEALVDGARVALTGREFELLRVLAEHPRQVLRREQLLDSLWDGYADAATLWGYVRKLREKVEEDPAVPRHIVTVWGVGYRFEPDAG